MGIGTVATSAGYDAVAGKNTQPDDSLYALERVGEKIRRGFTNSPSEADLAGERLEEYRRMARKGKAARYLGILDDAQGRMLGSVLRERSTVNARNRVAYHIFVLENLRDVVPENALAGINRAIEASDNVLEILENVPGETIPENAKARVDEIRKGRPPISPPGPRR